MFLYGSKPAQCKRIENCCQMNTRCLQISNGEDLYTKAKAQEHTFHCHPMSWWILMVTADFECTTDIVKWQLEGGFGGSHTAAKSITKMLLDSNLATYNQFLNAHIVCARNYIHRNQPGPMSQASRCLPQYYLQYRDTGDILILRRIAWEIQGFYIVK